MKTMKLRLPVIVTCIDDGYYFAEIPVIRGSTEGETKEEVLKKIQDVVRLCLGHAAEECETIPTKYTMEQIDVTVSEGTGARVATHPVDNRLAAKPDCWYNEHC